MRPTVCEAAAEEDSAVASTKKSLAEKAASRRRRPADPLRVYHERRDFSVTREPRGRAAKSAGRALRFVVQKHDATRLHYDFRLEHAGALWSWAVPKGPSLDPEERRLAVRTEDHPIAYADFEGVIPEGEYGAGRVSVWDRGQWTPDGDPAAGMSKGHLAFRLDGEKLRGRFHLVRLANDSGKENWLLFKSKEERAKTGVPQTNRPRRARPRKPRPSQSADAALMAVVRSLPVPFALTDLERTLYPESGVQKVHLLAYYASIAPQLLPHVGRRPLSIVRCPEGASKKCVSQKHANGTTPAVVGRVSIVDGRKQHAFMFIEDLAGLIALGQMGALELHAWMCHVDDVERPDELVLEIDPDPSLPFDAAVETAFLVRARLDSLGLRSFVKTTGDEGLHVVLPVRGGDWEAHESFAHDLVAGLVKEHPATLVASARGDQRRGKVVLDGPRNGRGAAAVVPYSPRARPGAPVATPLSWDELSRPLDPRSFTFASVLHRVATVPDAWRDFSTVRQSITKKTLAAVTGGKAGRAQRRGLSSSAARVI